MSKLDEKYAIYHEKQSWEMCLLHALNNLFQGAAFSRQTLEDTCKQLSPESWHFANPHKSAFGTGNYDVNVLLAALQTKDCSAVWWDRRRDVRHMCLENIVGFVLNVPSAASFGFITVPFIKRRHWVAVRLVGGAYFNLDSKLAKPELIGDETTLFDYLNGVLVDSNNQIFVVISSQFEQTREYLLPQYRTET